MSIENMIEVYSTEHYKAIVFNANNVDLVSKFIGHPIQHDGNYYFVREWSALHNAFVEKEIHENDVFVKDGNGKCVLYDQKDFEKKFKEV